MSNSGTTIPITAIVGFLGSGKTTLLNHLLRNANGRKIAVIVNDYGDINIDASLVAGQTDTAIELSNGCVCCTLDSLELDDAIGQFAYKGSPIDQIVIEASGLAEPLDLARTLQAATGQHSHFEACIGLIDSVNIPAANEPELRLITDTIKAADILVTTKSDLATPGQLARLDAVIGEAAPKVRRLTSVNGNVDTDLLLGLPAHPHHDHHHQHDHSQHLHETYQTVSFRSQEPLDPLAFQKFVNTLLPTTIYRAKGSVDLGEAGLGRKYIFQLVGKRADIHWEEWGDTEPRTELVFIGRDIDETTLLQQLSACIAATTQAEVAILAQPKSQSHTPNRSAS